MSSTLRKSLRILEAIATSEGPRGISELARETGLDKSAVQRIVQTLAEEAYIVRVAESGRYRPTLRIWEFGARVIAQNEMRRSVHPILRYAAKISGLTAFFTLADLPDIVFLDKVEGEKGRANSSDPGRRTAMHTAASGRAILAFLPRDDIERQLEAAAADGLRPDELRRELEIVRSRLFAATERGTPTPVSSIAAPVWGPGAATPIGSIVLTSDSTTLPRSDFERIGAVAVQAAEQATGALGGVFASFIDVAP